MNIHAYRIFMKVAKHKSVTLAAQDLTMTQPAVTIQLRNLERELKMKLIQTRGRGIELTLEGEFVYKQGLRLFQLEEEIEHKILRMAHMTETNRIATSYIPMHYMLPEMIAKYKQHKPLAEFTIELSNVKTVVQKVMNYEADYGFVVQSEEEEMDLQYEKLNEIDFGIVVHPTHHLANKTITLQALSDETFIYREKGSSTRDLLEAVFYANDCPLPKKGLQLQGLFESIRVVQSGYGMILAPNLSVEPLIEQQQLASITIKGIQIKQSLYLCIRKNELETYPFVDFVLGKMKSGK